MKVKILLTLIVFLINTYSLFPNKSNTQFQQDTSKINQYLSDLNKYGYHDLKVVDSFLSLAKEIVDRIPECEATTAYYQISGVLSIYKEDVLFAKTQFTKGLEIAKKLGLKNRVFALKLNLASLNLNLKLYPQAHKSLLELLPDARNRQECIIIYGNLILSSLGVNDTNAASMYLEKMKKDCSLKSNSLEFLFEKLKVRYTFKDAQVVRKMALDINDFGTLLREYELTIENLIDKKQYHLAEKQCYELKKYSLKYGYDDYTNIVNYFLGIIFFNTEKYKEAINCLKKYDKVNNEFYILETKLTLAKSYSKLKEFNMAYSTMLVYDSLKDKLLGLQKQMLVSDLNIQYNVNEKQEKINQQELKNKIQERTIQVEKRQKKILLGLITLIFALLILAANAFYNQYKLRKELGIRNIEIEQKAKELTDSNHTKDKLFTVIAHDLRSPINAYQNLGITINYLIKTGNYSEIQLISNKIDEMGLHLNNLLNNLLSWSLIQQNKLSITKSHFSLSQFLYEILPTYDFICEQKDINFVKNIRFQGDIFCSKINLSIILRNLIDNAIKHSIPNSQISLCVVENSHRVLFEISNEVIISENELNIIKSYFQTRGKDTISYENTTLGLELISQGVQNMNGIMEINYNQGVLTFIFKINLL